jgi:hypothetical protein
MGDKVFEIAEAGTAKFLGHRQPEETRTAQLGPEIRRKIPRALDFVGMRKNLPVVAKCRAFLRSSSAV